MVYCGELRVVFGNIRSEILGSFGRVRGDCRRCFKMFGSVRKMSGVANVSCWEDGALARALLSSLPKPPLLSDARFSS